MINFPYLFGSISNSLMKNDLSQPNFWFDFTKKNYEFWNITLPCWPFSQNKVLLCHRTNYFSFLLLQKKKSIFSWKLSSKMLVLKKVKSHSEKKRWKIFINRKKYVKNNSYLYFLIHFQKQILKQLSMTAQQLLIEKC